MRNDKFIDILVKLFTTLAVILKKFHDIDINQKIHHVILQLLGYNWWRITVTFIKHIDSFGMLWELDKKGLTLLYTNFLKNEDEIVVVNAIQ